MTRRQFLGAARRALCVAAPLPFPFPLMAARRRRHALLAEDSRPPDFTLPDSAGRPVRLGNFLGRKRIVLAFRPRAVYLDDVLAVHEKFEARDLIVIAVGTPTEGLEGKPSETPVYVLTDRTGATLRAYGAEGHAPTFYLVGKDGTIKMARRGYPDDQELFGTIDAMPMRRQEMRERGR